MQAYMDTLHATQRESNFTTTMFQDIPIFDEQDSSKLEDWFMDIETTSDILTESYTHLPKAKSDNLMHTLISEATQTGECWDEIKGILRLKLCNANIYTYTSWFMEIQQNDKDTLASYIHYFKIAAKKCAFDNDIVVICSFVKGLRDAPSIASKLYERTPKLWLMSSDLLRCSVQHTQLTATLTPSAVSMMSGNNRCFVCEWTDQFGCHFLDVQCYCCVKFGHFAEDCPHKIPPSGTLCHHRISCSMH